MDGQDAHNGETNLAPILPAVVPGRDPNRNEKGQFIVGKQTGREKGSINRITRQMRDELARRIEETGTAGNPLAVMHEIMMNQLNHPSLRLQAAARLTQYLMPKLLSIEMEAPDASFHIETQRITETLRAYFGAKEPK